MGIGVQHIGAQGGQIFEQAIQDIDGFPHPARDEVTKEGDIRITNVMVGLSEQPSYAKEFTITQF